MGLEGTASLKAGFKHETYSAPESHRGMKHPVFGVDLSKVVENPHSEAATEMREENAAYIRGLQKVMARAYGFGKT